MHRIFVSFLVLSLILPCSFFRAEAAEIGGGELGIREVEELIARSEESIEEGKGLKKEWSDEKGIYRKKFEAVLEEMDTHLKGLNHARDFGNSDLRDTLHETRADIERMKSDLEQLMDELKVTAAVRVTNIKSDLDDAAEDIRD